MNTLQRFSMRFFRSSAAADRNVRAPAELACLKTPSPKRLTVEFREEAGFPVVLGRSPLPQDPRRLRFYHPGKEMPPGRRYLRRFAGR